MSYCMKCLSSIVVISFLTGCGGENGGEKPSSGNNNNDVSQSEQFKYPYMFQNFENFKAGGIPLEKNNLFELTVFAIREKPDLDAILLIENNQYVNRSHCEKGTAEGIGLTISKGGGSYSGEFIYTKSSGVMLDPLISSEEDICTYSDFLDGIITFNVHKTGKETYESSATLKGPFFIRDGGSGYFDGATAYTGSYVSELTENGIILTSPSMEVFTVVSPASKQTYEKGNYSEEDKVYFKNYRQTAITVSSDITEGTLSFEAQWHENDSDFVLSYDNKNTERGETLTTDESYELRVVGDESKMVEGTVHRVIYKSGRYISNSTWIKDGKTKTEAYDSNDFIKQ